MLTYQGPAFFEEALRDWLDRAYPSDPDRAYYSLSQLIAPTTQMALKMLMPYEVDADSLLAAAVGIVLHDRVLRSLAYKRPDVLVEQYLTLYEADGSVLTAGRLDAYDPRREDLWDLKVAMGPWAVQEVLKTGALPPEHVWQLNIYRLMLEQAGHTVMACRVFYIVLDKGPRLPRRLWEFEAPILPDDRVRDFLRSRTTALREEIGRVRRLEAVSPCPPDERKMGADVNGRCRRYCAVHPYCPFYWEEVDGREPEKLRLKPAMIAGQ